MTRINVGIPPRKLTNVHLLSEHREIKRIPNNLANGKVDLSKPIPNNFTLDTGHVRFFYDKGLYTYKRYIRLYDECIARGFNVQFYGDAWKIYEQYPHLNKDYRPTWSDIFIIVERLIEKNIIYENICKNNWQLLER